MQHFFNVYLQNRYEYEQANFPENKNKELNN